MRCLWNGTRRPCYLFARKFLPHALTILCSCSPITRSSELMPRDTVPNPKSYVGHTFFMCVLASQPDGRHSDRQAKKPPDTFPSCLPL
ncbi:hypothetical protein MUK42_26526 [Musa troglodytarum]|uniref:Uncharacterized protein n=1 Tax=Musa troglodytarum TaxID=320322 RepID=A0A9E7JLC6_9LILI|nr:hypothetical protein MUK42_26526 [Musa troglodytarum]